MSNIVDLDKKYVLPTYARADVEFVSGSNARLVDSEGKKYVDFASGIAVCSVGHANKRVNDAICKQLSNITHTSNLYYIAPQARAAQKIVEASGYDMKCFFGNSGAEANEGAIKIARKFGEKDGEIKRYKVITLQHSFHGRTITTVKATGQEKMHNYFGPYPDGFVYADNIEHVASLVDEHTCAVMIELVQGEGGVQPLDKKAVQELAKFLKLKNVLLMIDEVQTGVYRTGKFLAANYYEIEPDVVTLAKGLGGGVPIGVVMTTQKDVFSAGDHGSTFGGNFLSTTAACEVVDILNEIYDSGELQKNIDYFDSELEKFYTAHKDIFTSKVGIGMMCGLRVKDGDTLTKIIYRAREEGVIVLKAGRDTLRLLPALTITKEEIDEGFISLNRALNSL
ncbi:MAG: acetylornithine aminotransferase [Sulfurimonas sp. RIFCSPHIGHO2_12_FULL_36_9]|uniref:aspartate aminotransferase family protein n=1 Tax=Sulfurimonas sp. RIFCSPLOWO2_12_36_12 TaxID=1802253 RepID=UPI0008B50689|nr:aspartate aminotransferase family protein [Sulfurimonas sp. RIFCSPLOWO2_12_36_12]OHD98180.1 MAG: acetylornithine aminotransferase [Sulfurimonas sp. RIFCSPHIGHO2_12_FULL_36_9]OHD99949.1 MAG: acetylornithine aminotransferase [Sulfurimonas sp. RIFCSPLOWO2_02_FULL_36_28]OHE00346.1 MAG: acetylornithine aminotransferase [Sulfurimonas sp. RIFCSPLOWO2_12_36_12]OHE02686.1 MAG: acetylornithine aminotransferase [Sulfurimonas sp. RIFCSPLOWO2_12_FULL_36_74]